MTDEPAAEVRHCGKCGGRSAEGFVIDMGYGEVKPARWQEGTPKTGWTGSVKVDKKALLPLRAFRCERCHLVEFYAD